MPQLINSWVGYISLFIFALAYVLIMLEDRIILRKSKPAVLLGCLMWILIGVNEAINGGGHAGEELKHLIGEIAELFFFLLVAMTYINSLRERLVFAWLKSWLVRKGYSYRALFWLTGIITFFLSAVADNLTSALIMATVINTVGGSGGKFLAPAFINIVVAANAGGAWSPFGDVTTLMVWTAGKVETAKFLSIFLPSVINWLVPAAIMSFSIPAERPAEREEHINMKPGARRIIFLGFATIAITVVIHHTMHLPPFMGMMTGLGLLMFLAFVLQRQDRRYKKTPEEEFNIFRKIERVEFDTLLFFFGIITAVGALQYIGHLAVISKVIYGGFGDTFANITAGVISAIVDNIPLMYAILKMKLDMGIDQWLLITLTVGTGGSLLSIGSAAGVAVMGVNREVYTFTAHLKWTPVVALGYFASSACWWLMANL